MDDVFAWPDAAHAVRVTVRLFVASVLGGVIGLEREITGKAAGLRTHMLVALGAAVFTLAPHEAGMSIGDLSRVFQGLIAGIGFIGAGAILKLPPEERILGLTTAASIWLTAAVGSAVAVGALWLPVLAVGMAIAILLVVGRLEPNAGEGRVQT
jgi:putative Mg2+ transporter-C (MgtC) family protein